MSVCIYVYVHAHVHHMPVTVGKIHSYVIDCVFTCSTFIDYNLFTIMSLWTIYLPFVLDCVFHVLQIYWLQFVYNYKSTNNMFEITSLLSLRHLYVASCLDFAVPWAKWFTIISLRTVCLKLQVYEVFVICMWRHVASSRCHGWIGLLACWRHLCLEQSWNQTLEPGRAVWCSVVQCGAVWCSVV